MTAAIFNFFGVIVGAVLSFFSPVTLNFRSTIELFEHRLIRIT